MAVRRHVTEPGPPFAPSICPHTSELPPHRPFRYPDTDGGKAQCLADFRQLVAEIETKLAAYFDLRPKQPMKVQPVPKHMEEGSPGAFYMPPSLDGTRDGVFYANLGDMGAQYKYGMRTLTAHEAVPGHHFQLAIQFEMEVHAILGRRELPEPRARAPRLTLSVGGRGCRISARLPRASTRSSRAGRCASRALEPHASC